MVKAMQQNRPKINKLFCIMTNYGPENLPNLKAFLIRSSCSRIELKLDFVKVEFIDTTCIINLNAQ